MDDSSSEDISMDFNKMRATFEKVVGFCVILKHGSREGKINCEEIVIKQALKYSFEIFASIAFNNQMMKNYIELLNDSSNIELIALNRQIFKFSENLVRIIKEPINIPNEPFHNITLDDNYTETICSKYIDLYCIWLHPVLTEAKEIYREFTASMPDQDRYKFIPLLKNIDQYCYKN
ncbi:hypothetical protein MXB_1120 [Myxobolus squamalis]|nr:hypothetical protein MXB_1120 [Myxobolus squamalis]